MACETKGICSPDRGTNFLNLQQHCHLVSKPQNTFTIYIKLTLFMNPLNDKVFISLSLGVSQENSAVFLQYPRVQRMEGKPVQLQILENKILQRFVTKPLCGSKRFQVSNPSYLLADVVVIVLCLCLTL